MANIKVIVVPLNRTLIILKMKCNKTERITPL